MSIFSQAKACQGQMTVEFVVAFPVFIAIAIIGTQALLVFSECSMFDNAFRDAARIHGSSVGLGETNDQSIARIQQDIDQVITSSYSSCTVASITQGNHIVFEGMLECRPTLFGIPLKSSLFGVTFPTITHHISIVIDPYKPGVLI